MSEQKHHTHHFVFIFSLILTVAFNTVFYKQLAFIYAGISLSPLFGLSTAFVLFLAIYNFMLLLSWKHTTKPVVALSLIFSSIGAYLNLEYDLSIFDILMANSALNNGEVNYLSIFSLKSIFYISILIILPSYFIYRIPITYSSFKKEVIIKLLSLLVSGIFIHSMYLFYGDYFIDVFTTESQVLSLVNPFGSIYSLFSYFSKF